MNYSYIKNKAFRVSPEGNYAKIETSHIETLFGQEEVWTKTEYYRELNDSELEYLPKIISSDKKL